MRVDADNAESFLAHLSDDGATDEPKETRMDICERAYIKKMSVILKKKALC
jgi:hypothetical protein